jgi:erythromycin esterase
MKKITILLVNVFLITFTYCQSNVRVINTIYPNESNSNDLKFLDTILKDKSMILLGEDTHFDGSTMLAKLRIIEYLHDHLGFEILLDERNIYEAYRAVSDVEMGKDSMVGAFCFLTEAYASRIAEHDYFLAKYMDSCRKVNKQLQYYGFDIVKSSPFFLAFPSEVLEIIQKYSSKEKEEFFLNCWKSFFDIGNIKIYGPSKRKVKAKKYDIPGKEKVCLELVAMIEDILKGKGSALTPQETKKLMFISRSLLSDLCFMKQLESGGFSIKSESKYSSLQIREKGLSDNLIWFIENYCKNKKIIISASSFHIGRKLNTINPLPDEISRSTQTMTDVLWSRYPDKIYSIAFIDYQGLRGAGMDLNNLEIWETINTKPSNTMEYLLHNRKSPYLFYDISKRLSPEGDMPLGSFTMYPTFEKPYNTQWADIYDGLFYIDTMRPFLVKYLANRDNLKEPYKLDDEWLKK